mmetsp:Transcript_4175/g.4876  ORF Transcript_4175/g.4876 Transcript_4175/m.4876 type:complete len:432 (-) Transcript_4175:127-1422(-)
MNSEYRIDSDLFSPFICHPERIHSWRNVVPIEISKVCLTDSRCRVQLPSVEIKEWFSVFPECVKKRLVESNLLGMVKGTPVVYFPEGHAYTRAHTEAQLTSELLRNIRGFIPGPSSTLPSCLEPIVCQVSSISFHMDNYSIKKDHSDLGLLSPYCVVTLIPVKENQKSQLPPPPMIGGENESELSEVGLTASESSRRLSKILLRVVDYLLTMEETRAVLHSVSSRCYPDYDKTVEADIDFFRIQSKIIDAKYRTHLEFIDDLELMAGNYKKYFLERHNYGPLIPSAAGTLLFEAKRMLRHPEVLCALNDLESKFNECSSTKTNTKEEWTVVIRPHLEKSIPSYLVMYAKVMHSCLNIGWKIGDKVRRRSSDEVQQIVGLRFSSPRSKLSWASVILNKSKHNIETLDCVFDMPLLADLHANPFELMHVPEKM